MSDGPIRLGEEVADALAEGRAVLALESTILAHGFPAPLGRQLADELEACARAEGATPATVAVLDGVIRVGLDQEGLDRITDQSASVEKCAALDLAVHCARGTVAATTVSGTCFAASLAGIRFFATGGIGGVHRGNSGDVSSDLLELSRSPVAVISAGAKSILDLPRTLEHLESLGVLVVGYRTSEFPAFYLPSSSLPLSHREDSVAGLCSLIRWRLEVLGQGGILVCNPIPEDDALEPTDIDGVITSALAAADDAGIRGKALTPFLLARVAAETQGRAPVANRALALNNTRLGAQLAAASIQG